LSQDPFAFVLSRGAAFYATDFKRLLWSLPYYKGEVRIGTLLAVPVRVTGSLAGVLIVDRLEIQTLTEREPDLLAAFAEMAADAVQRTRAALTREELGAEFKAIYAVSRNLAALIEPAPVYRLLLRSARDLAPIDAAAMVMADEAQTRYTVVEGHGWAKEFEGREVGLSEKTWAAWVLQSAEDPYLLDDIRGQSQPMPILVLDEGGPRSDSLLAVPLKSRNRTLGALLLLAKRNTFDAAAHRVLGILANQAAAALSTIQLMERVRDQAIRDGLTGLYNRRAFDEFIAQAQARQDRQGGSFALLLVDLDHFKKLNDTYGHPTGDAALRSAAHVLTRHLRRGDQAARYGGEEFVVILPATDEAGAVRLAERVRSAIEKHRLVFEGARVAITASIGVAIWPQDAKDTTVLLAATDRALYAAKQGGRNRVVPASSLPPLESANGETPHTDSTPVSL
jgi:diguanylate cyclase (GGDEF)-like protein